MSAAPEDPSAEVAAPRFEPGVSAEAIRLAESFQVLADQLPNPWDESTDFFYAFAAALPAGTPLDAETFARALGVAAPLHVELSPAAAKLTALGAAQSPWGPEIAGKFRALGQAMTAALGELSLAHARGDGVVRVRLWLFGRSADGTLIGVRSISTET